MDDRSDRQIVYRDRQYTKGYRACGGYGIAEVLLMGARMVGSGSGCGASGVTTDRFDRLSKEHSYRRNRSK